MSSRDTVTSLTERSYWEGTWQASDLPKLVDLSDRGLRNRATLALHRYFSEVLQSAPQNGTLVEVGCAQSKWLPYFAKVHGMRVTGLDYTTIGCARARALLQWAQCDGEIIEADVFNLPDDLRSRFDVVLSIGLVEHFPDTASAVCACVELAKPGGIVLTLIPNLSGLVGVGQRLLDRAVYNKHVPLDREALRAAHEACGLSVLRSEYLLSANFAVINHPNLRPTILNKAVRGLLVAATGAVWVLEKIGIPVPATRLISPYAVCVARKAGAASGS